MSRAEGQLLIKCLPGMSFAMSFPNPVSIKVGSDFFFLSETIIFYGSDVRGDG